MRSFLETLPSPGTDRRLVGRGENSSVFSTLDECLIFLAEFIQGDVDRAAVFGFQFHDLIDDAVEFGLNFLAGRMGSNCK
jgi:hypothetical protein